MLFYFDVRDYDAHLYSDEEGQELPNIDAARREAAEAAVSIAGELLPVRKDKALPSRYVGEIVVEVRDQARQLLATVSVELRVAPA